MEATGNVGPVRFYIPARVEVRCADCRFFTSHVKSWCVHPLVLEERMGMSGGYIISDRGDDVTPPWCPQRRSPREAGP